MRPPLNRLSRDRGLSIPDPLEALTRRAEDDRLLADHNATIERVMNDPTSASAFTAELSAWDGTLKDGLSDL
jgi:hypothetical protein